MARKSKALKDVLTNFLRKSLCSSKSEIPLLCCKNEDNNKTKNFTQNKILNETHQNLVLARSSSRRLFHNINSTSSSNKVDLLPRNCGIRNSLENINRIVGGSNSILSFWPWIALLYGEVSKYIILTLSLLSALFWR